MFVDENNHSAPRVINLDGSTIINPTDEQYIAAGYHLYEPHVPTKPSYEVLVTRYIRERYSSDAVEALYANYLGAKLTLQEGETNPYLEELQSFEQYRNECKERAKQYLKDE